ncbi:ATP binding microtubule motor family protein [Striga asiatica]|uniref:ATP binding microtubule motor family protein n=1 Tax=Striga asiatica TaxID=4170 RepID=A0A5A7QQY4_STRAF|nr:ATP binding microtubule motor family protein [Striga asiatica]
MPTRMLRAATRWKATREPSRPSMVVGARRIATRLPKTDPKLDVRWSHPKAVPRLDSLVESAIRDWMEGITMAKPIPECGGDGNEEGSGGPEEGTEGDDVRPVVASSEVGGDREAQCLHERFVEGKRAQMGGVGMQRFSDLLVNRRQQLLVSVVHYSGEVHQKQAELRSPEPSSASSCLRSLLKEKDSKIQQLEREINELKRERDLAQSQLVLERSSRKEQKEGVDEAAHSEGDAYRHVERLAKCPRILLPNTFCDNNPTVGGANEDRMVSNDLSKAEVATINSDQIVAVVPFENPISSSHILPNESADQGKLPDTPCNTRILKDGTFITSLASLSRFLASSPRKDFVGS